MATTDGRIYTSDILADDNLDALIQKIGVLEKSIVSLMGAIHKNEMAASELEQTTAKLSTSTAAGRDGIAKAAKATDELEQVTKRYNQALSEEKTKVEELKIAVRTINELKKNEARLNLSAEGSYNRLAAQYNIIKLNLNAMSKAEREGTEEGRKLVKTANDIYQEMKRLQAETGKNVLNVGNYGEAVQQASQNVGEMRKELMALRNLSFAGKTEEEIAQINKRIGDLVDGMADLKAEQAALGTEMSTLFVSNLKFVSAGVEGLVGTLSLLGVESENLRNLESKLLQLIAVTQALSEIEDVLQKRTLQTTYARIQSTLATARDSVAKQINIIQTVAAARAEEAKAIAIGRGNILARAAAAAQWAWNAALAANPIGLVVAGLLTLLAVIPAIAAATKTTSREFEKLAAQRKINNELSEMAAVNAVDERVKVESLIGVIKAENTTKAQKKRALEEINKVAPEYFKGLTIEKDGVEAIAKVYTEKYLPALERRVKFEAATQKLTEIEKELLSTTKQLEDTKPGYFQAGVAYIKNFGNSVDAATDLANDWSMKLAENKQRLEDEKEAIYKFIQTNDLAVEALGQSTEATEKNTKAKKEAIDLNEKAATMAAMELQMQRELAELLANDPELPMLMELSGGKAAEAFGDGFQRSIEAGLSGAKGIDFLPNIFEANAREDILARAQQLGKNVGDGLNDGIRVSALERLQQGESVYDLLGINLGDGGEDALKSSLNFAKQQLTEFAAFRVQIASQNVAAAQQEVESAREALRQAEADRAAGLANLVETRRKDLDDAERNQQKALRQQEKAQRQQQAIQTIEQASNLITAVSQLFVKPGLPAAIPLAALMIGSFVGFKVAALAASRRQFKEGGLEILEGGSHASGNDIPLGVGRDGRERRAEGGEAMMILSRESTAKYRSILPNIFEALKQKRFESEFMPGKSDPFIVVGASPNIRTDGMETELRQIRRQGEMKEYRDGQGRLVVKYKNLTQTYLN